MQSGIFIVDKPLNLTSNQVVQKIKRQFKLTKVGHAGTLDPLATGVLIVLVNQATKLSDLLLNETKKYFVKVQLYSSTTTGDVEGDVVESMPNLKLVSTAVEAMIAKYQNYVYDQIPPIYSAIKKDGKKLYEYARSGQVVEVNSRKVEIIQTTLIDYDLELGQFSFETLVSKGTYIRSLVNDMAMDLKTVGHVIELRRTASGNFSLEQATSLEQLTESNLIPSLAVVEQLDIVKYELNEQQYKDVSFGKLVKLDLDQNQVFLTYQNQLVALYGQTENQIYKSIKNNLN